MAALAAGRLAMRKQTSPDGELAGLAPKFLIVPPELELLGEQILAVVNAEKAADVNPFSGKLTLLVELSMRTSKAPQARKSTSGMASISMALSGRCVSISVPAGRTIAASGRTPEWRPN